MAINKRYFRRYNKINRYTKATLFDIRPTIVYKANSVFHLAEPKDYKNNIVLSRFLW